MLHFITDRHQYIYLLIYYYFLSTNPYIKIFFMIQKTLSNRFQTGYLQQESTIKKLRAFAYCLKLNHKL